MTRREWVRWWLHTIALALTSPVQLLLGLDDLTVERGRKRASLIGTADHRRP